MPHFAPLLLTAFMAFNPLYKTYHGDPEIANLQAKIVNLWEIYGQGNSKNAFPLFCNGPSFLVLCVLNILELELPVIKRT